MILRAAIALSLIHFSFMFAMDRDRDKKDRDKIEIQITSSMPQSKLVLLDFALDLSQVEKVIPYVYETDETNVESYSAQFKNGQELCLTYFHKGPNTGKTVASLVQPDMHITPFLRPVSYENFNKLKALYLKQIKKDTHVIM